MKYNPLKTFIFLAGFLPLVLSGQTYKPESTPDTSAAKIVHVQIEPVPINMVDIKTLMGYPLKAKLKGIEGKVIVRVLIDKEGKVIKHAVIQNPHDMLTDHVVQYLPFLIFWPGLQDGEPVKVWVTIPFDFSLSPRPN